MAERLVFNSQAANHVQAYIDYCNIVGDADGGKLMSEQEYEQFKKKQIQGIKNRIYASWRNQKGLDCKMIGPASMCFCGHRFKEHEYLNPKNKKVVCKKPKCSCPCFNHIPQFGSNDFKCLCKHSYTEHDPITKKCTKGQCGCNQRFQSGWTCSCGSKYGEHVTIIETRDERVASGKPVDDMMRLGGDMNVPYMPGGLASFQSLVDGADGYQAYIDQLQGQQPAIGYQQQKALIQVPKKAKLQNLNQKMNQQQQQQQQQKQFNQRESLDQFVDEQSQQLQLQNVDTKNSLLHLFNTPHIYNIGQVKGMRRIKQ